MDHVKTLAEVKQVLTDIIREIEDDLENRRIRLDKLRDLNNMIDQVLVQNSFKTAGEVARDIKVQVLRIADKEDRDLVYAIANIQDNEMIITPYEDILYSVDHSAFKQFLLGKVLDPPQSEDAKRIEKGELTEEEAFSYSVEVDEDRNLQRLIIRNIHSETESKKIFGALRWTFGKISRS